MSDLSYSQTLLLVCNKLRNYLMEEIRRGKANYPVARNSEKPDEYDWREDAHVLTFGQLSYAWFWEWVKQDTQIQERLESIGIPCEKELRDAIAHASIGENTKCKIIEFIRGICSDKFAALLVSYLSDEFEQMLVGQSTYNKWGKEMNPVEI